MPVSMTATLAPVPSPVADGVVGEVSIAGAATPLDGFITGCSGVMWVSEAAKPRARSSATVSSRCS